jgi:hypothetical protein
LIPTLNLLKLFLESNETGKEGFILIELSIYLFKFDSFSINCFESLKFDLALYKIEEFYLFLKTFLTY